MRSAPSRSAIPSARLWFGAGATMGFAALVSATLAAHLPDPDLHGGGREALRAAAQILGWHAAALLATGLWLRETAHRRLVHLAGGCFVLGSLGFCVGVDVPTLGGPHLGRLAPFGGSLLLGGWVLLAASAFIPERHRDQRRYPRGLREE